MGLLIIHQKIKNKMDLFKKSLHITSGVVLFSGLLLACKVQQPALPAVSLPTAFRNSDSLAINDTSKSIGTISYKDFFTDATLLGLLDKAMLHNNDLNVAVKQIQIASLGFEQSRWAFLPKVSATIGSTTITRPSDNSMNGLMAGQFLGQKYIGDYNSLFNISWEADIWGKMKGQKEAALSEYLKTQEAAKAVRTRIVVEVVQGYYNLLMLDKQIEISNRNLLFADSTLTFLKKQFELGLINSLAVQQQEVTIDQISKSIPSIESAITLQENALSVLIGEMPDKISRTVLLNDIIISENLATGVPAQLLANRPDIKVSELDFRKAAASVHVAKVSMYPALNITAQTGLNAFKSSDWFKLPGSLFGIIAGSITQPVFQGKQLKVQYQQSKIMLEQSEIQFKQMILKAVSEVSDALVQIEKLKQQEIIAQSQVQKSDDLVNKALTLYKLNEATYLDVIVAQSNRLQYELDLASIKNQHLTAITMLYRSLGGGQN